MMTILFYNVDYIILSYPKIDCGYRCFVITQHY